MARTTMTVQEAVATGLKPTTTAGTSDGLQFSNDGKTLLYAYNGGAGAHVVTIQTPETVEGLAVAENTVTISQSTFKLIGPFARATFNQSNGYAYVDIDGTQSEVTCAAVRVTAER